MQVTILRDCHVLEASANRQVWRLRWHSNRSSAVHRARTVHDQASERWLAVARSIGKNCEGLRGRVEMISETWGRPPFIRCLAVGPSQGEPQAQAWGE